MPKYQRPNRDRRKRGLEGWIPFLLFLGICLVCFPGWAQEEEDEEEEEFKGVGVHIRLYGAAVKFSGGDLDRGTAGMYDRIAADLTASGCELVEKEKTPFTSGYGMGGDIVYYFTPRVGVGFGGNFTRREKENFILSRWPVPGMEYVEYRMTGHPELKVISLRVGIFLSLPLNRLLTVSASAGPAWHFVEFTYTGSINTPALMDHVRQEAKSGHWGIHGGVSLEVRMNRRLDFIIAAQGRYAKISGFEGKELIDRWESDQSVQIEENGTLYLIEGEVHPRLDIIPGELHEGLRARKAEFNFSGLSVQAGLNFKF